jgi:hypothetical protein
MPGPLNGGGAPTRVHDSVGVAVVDEVEVGTEVVFGIVTVENTEVMISKVDECVMKREEDEVLD